MSKIKIYDTTVFGEYYNRTIPAYYLMAWRGRSCRNIISNKQRPRGFKSGCPGGGHKLFESVARPFRSFVILSSFRDFSQGAKPCKSAKECLQYGQDALVSIYYRWVKFRTLLKVLRRKALTVKENRPINKSDLIIPPLAKSFKSGSTIEELQIIYFTNCTVQHCT